MVTYVLFSLSLSLPHNRTSSVMFRPTEIPGQSFFLAGGHVDYGKLVANHDKLLAAMRDFVGRSEIKLGKILYATEYRPQARVADKFSVGRVFIAGGTQHGLIFEDTDEANIAPCRFRCRPCSWPTRRTGSKHECAGCSES